MNKQIDINNFDFLRVIFALTVAFAHLFELSKAEIFQPYHKFLDTRLAINGFFVISGFLIAKSYESSDNVRNYLIKRAKRILPAYVFVVISCALLFYFISTKTFCNYYLSTGFCKYLMANLTFQNYIQPCLPGVFESNLMCAVNGALWTIKIEEAFYLLLPIFYLITKLKKSNILFFSIIVYLFSICYFNFFLSLDMYRFAKQLPGALAFFVTGIILYKQFDFFLIWKQYMIIPALAVFCLEQYVFDLHILKPLSYGFMIFYMAYSFRALNNFGMYGDFTYGIYIYHFPIIQIFVYFNSFNHFDPIATAFVVIILVCALSIWSWYFIELPFLSQYRKNRYHGFMKKQIC